MMKRHLATVILVLLVSSAPAQYDRGSWFVFLNDYWTSRSIHPNSYTKQEKQVLKTPAAATAITLGMTAPTLTATASTADDADGPWVNHATTNVSGNPSGVISAFTECRRDWNTEFIASVKLVDTASVRHWVGLFSASADASAIPDIHAAAFRYDTATDGTAFWRCVTIAGTGSGAQVTATTVATTVAVKHRFRIMLKSASVEFWIDDVLVATHTSVLPTATTLLGYGVRVITLTTVIKNIKWGHLVLRHY